MVWVFTAVFPFFGWFFGAHLAHKDAKMCAKKRNGKKCQSLQTVAITAFTAYYGTIRNGKILIRDQEAVGSNPVTRTNVIAVSSEAAISNLLFGRTHGLFYCIQRRDRGWDYPPQRVCRSEPPKAALARRRPVTRTNVIAVSMKRLFSCFLPKRRTGHPCSGCSFFAWNGYGNFGLSFFSVLMQKMNIMHPLCPLPKMLSRFCEKFPKSFSKLILESISRSRNFSHFVSYAWNI